LSYLWGVDGSAPQLRTIAANHAKRLEVPVVDAGCVDGDSGVLAVKERGAVFDFHDAQLRARGV
jgi:hypothetical protein